MAVHVAPIALLALLLPWSIYRRIRRNFGRQPLSPLRQKFRVGVKATIFTLIALGPLAEQQWLAVAAMAAGAALGVALSVYGLRHTRFEQADGAQFYVPNPYIGLTLSALLMARLAWRLWQLWPVLSQPGATLPPAFGGTVGPLTLLMIGALLAYYGAYYLGILRHAASPAR